MTEVSALNLVLIAAAGILAGQLMLFIAALVECAREKSKLINIERLGRVNDMHLIEEIRDAVSRDGWKVKP